MLNNVRLPIKLVGTMYLFHEMAFAKAPQNDFSITVDYTYMDYTELRQEINNLAQNNPEVVKLESAETAYGITHEENCGDEKCQVDILTLTANP